MYKLLVIMPSAACFLLLFIHEAFILRTVLSVSRVFRTIIPFESKPAAGKLGPISIRRIPRDGK